MRRTRNPKKSKARSMDAALNALLKQGRLDASIGDLREQAPLPTKQASKPRVVQQKRFIPSDEEMDDMFESVVESGALKVFDDEYGDEDEYSEDEEDIYESILDDDDEIRSGRDLIGWDGPIEGGRTGERRAGLERYDREWEEVDDDDGIHRNPATIFTPLNIGIGVTVLGLAGYFGYKHFKKEE
jgi:hypothetical protein